MNEITIYDYLSSFEISDWFAAKLVDSDEGRQGQKWGVEAMALPGLHVDLINTSEVKKKL